MFEKCDIEEMLKKYLISKSQLDELESKIDKNKLMLKLNGKKYKETDEEAIRGMSLKSPSISDVPKRKY